jgi:3-oxoacyl-[acyl-carrier protein] reductase
MDLGLKGKVAFVAAASKGLGRAVAEELAAEGASLVLCARSAENIAKAVQTGIKKFGRIDILVTNAGGPPAGQFESLSREMWEAATRLTLNSVLELTRAVLPGMKQQNWGRILNITSITVKQPVDNLMLSNSLRAAVTGFARTLANEVAVHGITVNNILPGYTRTERVEELARAAAERGGISAAEASAKWEAEIPMKRLGEPREFAALAAFLVSERASYITGTSIAVDGGWIRSLI